MNTASAIDWLTDSIDLDSPAFLWGSPGIGKSDIVRNVANIKTNQTRNHWNYIDFRALLRDPVELRGCPVPDLDSGTVRMLPVGELPNESRDGEYGILHLDEINAAPNAMQVALYGLVLDRQLGEYRLPPNWRIIACGNRQSDRAGASRMNSALANRFDHATLEPDLDSWCKWALANGIAAELISFLRFRPELFNDFNSDRIINVTPRSWARVSDLLNAKLPADREMRQLQGKVGDGPACELAAFLKIFRTLPNPDAILINPASCDVPNEPAALYAIAGALARKVTESTIGNMIEYLNRVPVEYAVMAIKDAIGRHKVLASTPEFVAWQVANSDVYV